jgi:transcriptional regulator of acetoin/glycerol metabolism
MHIERALAEHGKVEDAARSLGIPRSTMYQKLKTYGIASLRPSPQRQGQ